jgi:hypothetical protein
MRLRVDVERLSTGGGQLVADTVATGGTSSTPVELGSLGGAGSSRVHTGSLSGCPCLVKNVQINPPGGVSGEIGGSLRLSDLEVRVDGRWQPVRGAWQPRGWIDTVNQDVEVEAAGDGLRWSFFAVRGIPPELTVHDRPTPLPGVVVSAVAGNHASVQVSGLDGAPLEVSVTGRPTSVPGAPEDGTVVDLTYAERAAFGDTAPAISQIWVDGDADRIRRGLEDASIPIVSEVTSASVDAELSRQGPGLASVLFLADAAAAAVLAALAAVLSLSAAARRRRYEYAALAATGASSRTLYRALALEQVVVVGFGAAVRVLAGLASIAIAGPSVPEFVVQPAEVLLHHRPPVLLLVAVLGVGFVLLLAAALAAAAALLRSVSADQLREAPT